MSEKEALQDFSPTWEGVKSVGMKALKWAAYGAIGLAVLSMPFIAGGGAISTALSWVGVDTALGVGALGSALMNGAMIGGVLGLVKGAADMPEAIEDAKSERIEAYDNNQVRKYRAAQMREREQGQTVAMSNEQGLSSGIFGGKSQELAQVR